MTFKFKLYDLRPLWEHAKTSPENWIPYSGNEPGKPGLVLVKDQGVYLMSNGRPHLTRGGEANPNHHKVVYAAGHDPDKDTDWWLGGDDFAELLPFGDFFDKVMADPKRKYLLVKLTEDDLSLKAVDR